MPNLMRRDGTDVYGHSRPTCASSTSAHSGIGASWPMTTPSAPGQSSSSCHKARARRGYAGKRVELQLRIDGLLVIWDGEP